MIRTMLATASFSALLAVIAPAQTQLWGQYLSFVSGGYVASVRWPTPATDREAVDDYDVVGSITSVEVAGQVCYLCAPPNVLGVRLRFYAWTPTGPGGLLAESYHPAASPSLVFGPLSVTVILAAPFLATGRGYVGLQVESSNASGWGWAMTDPASVQLGTARMRDNLTSGGWVAATGTNGATGRDLSFVLRGTAVLPPAPPVATDPCGPFTILPIPIPPNATGIGIVGLRAFAPNDIWAAGNLFLPPNLWGIVDPTWIGHWDGTSWTRHPSAALMQGPTSRISLTAIGGSSSNDIWVVGSHFLTSAWIQSGPTNPHRALAMHFDGGSWVAFSPMSTTVALPLVFNDVISNGPNDAWLVGDNSFCGLPQALSLHWDGSTLSPVPTLSCTTPVVNTDGWGYSAIAQGSSGEYWAVGGGGAGIEPITTTLTMRWSGSAWSYVPGPTPGLERALDDVAAVPGVAWAVGGYYDSNTNTTRTLALRHDGTAWTQVADPPIPVSRVAVLPNGRAIIAGAGLAYWSGSAWIRSETFGSLGTGFVGAIDVMGPCSVAVAGGSSFGGGGLQPFVAYQDGGCFAHAYGSGANPSSLQLDFVPTLAPHDGDVRLVGAQPGTTSYLAISLLPDLNPTVLGTIFLSLDPAVSAPLLPVPIGTSGSFALPLDLHAPTLSGIILCTQVVALSAAGSQLSNGLQLGFCP